MCGNRYSANKTCNIDLTIPLDVTRLYGNTNRFVSDNGSGEGIGDTYHIQLYLGHC